MPLSFYASSAFQGIGDSIGRRAQINRKTKAASRGKFARLCVELDLTKTIFPKVFFGGRWQVVEYEGLHMLSFVDGFSGYNQIQMDPEHMTKTAFTRPWGTFCYTVMPFGLKKADATYQRAATILLHDIIHKEVEVYVDEIIIKSREREGHVPALRKFFERIREYKMRLNPQKCVFGVTAGKLLGFMVSQRGIEVDPAKIKAIMEMPPPRSEKEERGLPTF